MTIVQIRRWRGNLYWGLWGAVPGVSHVFCTTYRHEPLKLMHWRVVRDIYLFPLETGPDFTKLFVCVQGKPSYNITVKEGEQYTFNYEKGIFWYTKLRGKDITLKQEINQFQNRYWEYYTYHFFPMFKGIGYRMAEFPALRRKTISQDIRAIS